MKISQVVWAVGLTAASVSAGCSPADLLDAQVTLVDGKQYAVRQLKNRDNAWQSVSNEPTAQELLVIVPEEYGRNVRAIEQVSGCKVDLATIQNQSNNTIAAVVC